MGFAWVMRSMIQQVKEGHSPGQLIRDYKLAGKNKIDIQVVQS